MAMSYESMTIHDQRIREKLNQPDKITGSEMLLRSLLLEGVECVFGYPGGAVLFIYDAMHGNDDFRHILTRHEQGAIHAADGYARATGKVGVCVATSGPGATNLVTGIATAQMDSVPLVVITGNVATSLIGTDAFQEADIMGITMPITKHSYLVDDVKDLPRIIKEAFHIANTGRKGPVLIDIPKDVSAAVDEFIYPATIELEGYDAHPAVPQEQVNRLLEAIEAAEKPLILAGGGSVYADASEELLAFAEKTQVPVTTTLLGISGFPSAHPLWLGMPGMHGTYTANRALTEADLIISVGSRFDDRVTMKVDGFAPNAKFGHIDVDPAEIGKIVVTEYPVVGTMKAILQYANTKAKPALKADAWREKLSKMVKQYPLTYKDTNEHLLPQYVIQMISDTTAGEAVVTTDVGQHQMWVAQYYRFKNPRSSITSGGLGTMGFGFPSAIGAQEGRPGELVISINGDGGMQMCAQELAICAIHNIPVKIVVINNQTLGMIRQWQDIVYEGRLSHCDLSGSPDFVKLAEAYGVKGLRATNKEEAQLVWKEALATDGPVLIDFFVSKNENVYPMVPQGKSIDEMLMGDEDE